MPHLQYLLDGGKSSDAEYASLKAQHSGGGGAGGGDTKPPALPDIADFVGATVFDAQGNPYVVRTRQDRNLGTVYWMSGSGGRAFNPDATVWQTGTDRIIQFGRGGNIIADRNLSAAERAGGGGGGGDGASSASAAASLAESRRQFDISQKYQTEIDKARLAAEREANLRSELNDLRQARIRERMAAREQGTQLAGVDPFRTLGSLRARAVQGPTILDQFKGELGQAASFQEPMLGPGASMADLESAIAKMSQPILPAGGAANAFRPPGLEHGGTVSKEEVQPFTMGRPHPKTAIEFAKKAGMTTVMTGERTGGPELVIGKEFTVIPLTDEEEDELMHGPFDIPKAQAGVQVGSNFGLEGMQDLFTSLRKRAGLEGFIAQPGLGGATLGTQDVLLRPQAAALGAFQRAPGTLIQSTAGGGPTYVVDENGRLRAFTSEDLFFKSGYNWNQPIQQATPEQLARFERGADIGSPFTLPSGELGKVGALGSPLSTRQGFLELFTSQGLPPAQASAEADRLANLIGFVPSPNRVGGLFNRLLPAEQQALISAWKLSGIPEADVLAITGRAGIRGRERTGVFSG